MTIPTEVLIAILTPVAATIAGLFAAWRGAEKECDACREGRAGDASKAAELLTEQRIANIGSLSTITMREFERDTCHKTQERCERELERLREQVAKGSHS